MLHRVIATLLGLGIVLTSGRAATASEAPAWERSLPQLDSIDRIALRGNAVLVSGLTGIAVLDATTGRLRWQQLQRFVDVAADDAAVFTLDRRGTLARRSLADGRVRWRRTGVCPASEGSGTRQLWIVAGDLYLSCFERSSLARLDLGDGSIAARVPLSMQRLTGIAPVGRSALALNGWSDGAALRNDLFFVDRRTLHELAGDFTDTTFLGATRESALVFDWCCFGRGDDPSPGTFRRLALPAFNERGSFDARPDPPGASPTPAPVGHDAAAWFDGTHVIERVGTTLFDFGAPAQPLTPPHVLARDLGSVLVFEDARDATAHALLARTLSSGMSEVELADAATRPMRVRWRATGDMPAAGGIVADGSFVTVRVTKAGGAGDDVFVRTADGRALDTGRWCTIADASATRIIGVCTSASRQSAGVVTAWTLPPRR